MPIFFLPFSFSLSLSLSLSTFSPFPFLYFIKFCFSSKISILEKVLRAAEKNVYFAAVEYDILYMSVKSI
jgi:hypothetical protein